MGSAIGDIVVPAEHAVQWVWPLATQSFPDPFRPPPKWCAPTRRQREFLQQVYAALGNSDERTNKFRSISRAYRSGSVTADEYYKFWIDNLGAAAPGLFSQLVDLIPDEDLRVALLTAHNDHKARVRPPHRRRLSLLDRRGLTHPSLFLFFSSWQPSKRARHRRRLARCRTHGRRLRRLRRQAACVCW